jgi:hypothetical protein
MELTKSSLIELGKYQLSIGAFDTTELMLISKTTGKACEFKHIRKGGKLDKAKRMFKNNLRDSDAFYFERMHEEDTLKLIKLLKG